MGRFTTERFQYSARTFHKYLKVARTFGDMEGSIKIRKKDVAAALMAVEGIGEALNNLIYILVKLYNLTNNKG